MTKEEAINYFKRSWAIGEGDDSRYHNEVLEFTIKALEKEPCEDCISRKALLDKKWDVPFDGKYIQVVDVGDIKELPSVTLARKKGKWIYSGSYDEVGTLYCSNCQHEVDVSEGYFKYCPNCGIKMEE